MNAQNAEILLDRVARALRGVGLTVTIDNPTEVALSVPPVTWLSVCREHCRLTYAASFKRRVTEGTVGAVVARLRLPGDVGRPRPLLITEHVTIEVGEALRRHEQHFADAAGNAFLESENCFVWVSGRKLRDKTVVSRTGREFSVTRLKVLFALICDPGLAAAPYRAIATAAGVALGAMPAVIADLQQEGVLQMVERQRRLAVSKRLLDDWAHAYALVLRGKTLLARYQARTFDQWRAWMLDTGQLLWGGEPAAVLTGGDLTPGMLTIYGEKLPQRLIASGQLAVAGPLTYERLVELRKPFWGQSLRASGPAETVPAPLIYADLLATGSARCIEGAQTLYENSLAGTFPVTC